MKPLGYVYVLSNESMPGIVKIGMTERHVEARAEELHVTGTPTPFCIEYQAACFNPLAIEQTVHKSLDSKRVSASREFFRISPIGAVTAIRKIVGNDLIEEEISCERRESLAERWKNREEFKSFWEELRQVTWRFRETIGLYNGGSNSELQLQDDVDLANWIHDLSYDTPIWTHAVDGHTVGIKSSDWERWRPVYAERFLRWEEQFSEVCNLHHVGPWGNRIPEVGWPCRRLDLMRIYFDDCYFVYLPADDYEKLMISTAYHPPKRWHFKDSDTLLDQVTDALVEFRWSNAHNGYLVPFGIDGASQWVVEDGVRFSLLAPTAVD